MLPGYHQTFNGHAFAQVNRGVDMPDPQLGVGFAEVTAPTPLFIRYEPAVKAPDIPKLLTIEQASIDGQGRAVSLGDFPNMGYFGEQLGGF